MTDHSEVDWTRDRPALGERFVRREVSGFIVSVIDFPNAGRTPRHSHECAGFTLVLDGRYEKTIGARVAECATGMVTREPPGVTHAEVYHTNTASLLVEVLPTRFAQLAEIAPSLNDPAVTRDRALVRVARRAHREFRTTDAASTLALEAAVLEWAAAMARSPLKGLVGGRTPAWLARVEERLAHDWKRTPSVDELAADADVHPSHLTRAFRLHFGCSVGEYLRRRRVEWAANLLSTTSDSIASIAQRAGFFDQSHFTRVFLRTTGRRPGEYRNRATGDDSSDDMMR